MDLLVAGVREALRLLLTGDAEVFAILLLSLKVSGLATLILFVTLLLWRSGPLGGWEILYTPAAIVLGQAVIAAPIVTGITLAAVQNVPEKFRLQLLALGASRAQMVRVVVREARLPMLAAVMAGFGGIISEIGASMMVGGNIKGQTRTLTTAMVLETGKGNFEIAIALSLLLLVLVFGVNWILTAVQQRRVW
jgi:tungstate transport system permease protein